MMIISFAPEFAPAMFKDVSIGVKSRNDLQDAAKMNGTTLSVADCQPLDRDRMVMLLDLAGTPAAVDKTIEALRKMTGVEHAHILASGVPGTRVIVTLAKPGVCRASAGDALLCLDCPFNSTDVPSKWRFVTKRTTDVGQVVSRLAEEGVQAKIEDISPLDKNARLTDKEKEMIMVAIDEGYFDFPRKITLERLSQVLGVDTAALSKALHSVE